MKVAEIDSIIYYCVIEREIMSLKISSMSNQEVDNEFEEDSIEGLGMENGQLNSTLSRGKNKVSNWLIHWIGVTVNTYILVVLAE